MKIMKGIMAKMKAISLSNNEILKNQCGISNVGVKSAYQWRQPKSAVSSRVWQQRNWRKVALSII